MFDDADLKNIAALVNLAFKTGEVKDPSSAAALIALLNKAQIALKAPVTEPAK